MEAQPEIRLFETAGAVLCFSIARRGRAAQYHAAVQLESVARLQPEPGLAILRINVVERDAIFADDIGRVAVHNDGGTLIDAKA